MKIELKNVKHMPSLSDETEAYSATVYVDGERAFEVYNRGCGGDDDVRKVGTLAFDAVNSVMAMEYPAMDMSEFGMEDVPATLESVCHNLLYDNILVKDTRRAMRTHVVFIDAGEACQIKCFDNQKPCKPMQYQIGMVQERYPNALILNGQPDSLIVEKMKALG